MKKIVVFKESESGKESFRRPGDYYAIGSKENAFAVANSPLRSLSKQIRKYPQEDYGQDASRIFCQSVTKFLEKSGTVDKEVMKNSLNSANSEIRKFNKSIGKTYNDPLNYDMAEAVGAAACISDNKIYYGILEDCYIEVLDKDTLKDKVKLDYEFVKCTDFFNRMTKKGKIANYIPKELQKVIPKESWWESCWCNYQRNKPNFKDENGKKVGWGCFNGEKEAEYFYQIGSVDISKGDHIFLFSDGIIPLLENNDFLHWFIANAEDTFDFSRRVNIKITEIMGNTHDRNKDKTLIYIQY